MLYGPQWLGAAGVLRIYCVVGASQAIGSTVVWIYQSQGRSDWLLRWGLVASGVTIAGIVAGAAYGTIESVALGYGFVTVVVLAYPRFAIPGRLIGLRPRDVLGAVGGPLLAALAMSAVIFGLGLVLSTHLSTALDFALRATLGLVLYLILCGAFRVRGLEELRAVIRSRLRTDSEAPRSPRPPPA